MTTNTKRVPASFILKAHKAACPDWKRKLESKFPVVFAPEGKAPTFKGGDRIDIPDFGGCMIVQSGYNEFQLILVKNGNRLSDKGKIDVINSGAITVEELKKMIPSRRLPVFLTVNGRTVDLRPTPKIESVNVSDSYIKECHAAAKDIQGLQEEIEEMFPDLFVKIPEYVDLSSIFGGSDCKTLDDVTFLLGKCLAPNTSMIDRCLVISNADSPNIEVEVTKDSQGRHVIAFKKI